MSNNKLPKKQGLYDPQYEHDACGVGFVVNKYGKKTHEIVSQALTILINLDHRGGCGAEANTGDGAGILMQIPHSFMEAQMKKEGVDLPEVEQYAIGMIFASPDESERLEARKLFEQVVAEEGQKVIAWRDVPTHNQNLGKSALSCEPFCPTSFHCQVH